MMNAPNKKLDFAKPPVEEVVLSVLFKSLDSLLAPQLGAIWQELRKDGFVKLAEHPPVPSIVEEFPNRVGQPQLHIDQTPPLARIWFVHEDETRIIQVQRDRFTFNWRKTEDNPVYPGFSTIFRKFESFYNRFCQIIQNHEIGKVVPSQYELTYIDQLFQGDGWNTLEDLGKIYNIFFPAEHSDSFWAGTESMVVQTSFPIQDLRGRLYLVISNRVKMPEQRQTLQTDFTVRGFSDPVNLEMGTWFKFARDHIQEKFANIFTESIQTQIWGRKE